MKPIFETAFGKDVNEFKHIIEQPEEAIFRREKMEISKAKLVLT